MESSYAAFSSAFSSCVLLISLLSVCFMYHPHEHSDVLNGFLSFYVHFEPIKSVFRSPVCCDHDKKWSLNLKKAMKNNQHFERSISRTLLYQATLAS